MSKGVNHPKVYIYFIILHFHSNNHHNANKKKILYLLGLCLYLVFIHIKDEYCALNVYACLAIKRAERRNKTGLLSFSIGDLLGAGAAVRRMAVTVGAVGTKLW